MDKVWGFIWQHYLYTVIGLVLLTFFAGYELLNGFVYLVLLNSFYVGTVVSVLCIYTQWFFNALVSKAEYTRDRQYIIAVALIICGFAFVTEYSLRVRHPTDYSVPIAMDLLFGKYLAIVGHVLMVFIPDMGKSYFFGFNRRMFWIGITCGFITSALIFVAKIIPCGDAALGFGCLLP